MQFRAVITTMSGNTYYGKWDWIISDDELRKAANQLADAMTGKGGFTNYTDEGWRVFPVASVEHLWLETKPDPGKAF